MLCCALSAALSAVLGALEQVADYRCRADQFNLSLDPVTARSFHDATLPQEPAKVSVDRLWERLACGQSQTDVYGGIGCPRILQR